MSVRDEFFIGWQGRAPHETGRRLVQLAFGLGALAVVSAILFAAVQRTIGPAQWEYGHIREFTGLLFADPVPTLVLDAPEPSSGATDLLLVRPFKFGFDPETARREHLHRVTVRGTLLHRNGQAMLEVVNNGVVDAAGERGREGARRVDDLGEHVLAGEIVDAKCFLGAMNPGQLKPHRACAIRCISGGIPPMLLVHDPANRPTLYLITGPEGEPMNQRMLEFVAEPVEMRGRVLRLGEQLVLRVDPSTFRRVAAASGSTPTEAGTGSLRVARASPGSACLPREAWCGRAGMLEFCGTRR